MFGKETRRWQGWFSNLESEGGQGSLYFVEYNARLVKVVLILRKLQEGILTYIFVFILDQSLLTIYFDLTRN